MAAYIGPNGEVDAEQLHEDRVFNSGMKGRKGEWLVLDVDGKRRLCDPAAFATSFRQKYPRLAGEEGTPGTVTPGPMPLPPLSA